MTNKASRIEDYALIGDCRTSALVSKTGSIDWLCWPRFDSPACFAALLGDDRHGSWLIRSEEDGAMVKRQYRGDTLVLETVFETDAGSVALIDFMPMGDSHSSIVRRIEGRRGKLDMHMRFKLRFDYGSTTPWETPLEHGGGFCSLAGPNTVVLRTDVALQAEGDTNIARFSINAGEAKNFVLTWSESHLALPGPIDADGALAATEKFWGEWSSCCAYEGPYKKQVLRSLLTLKSLTYSPTGAIVAAPTTSLPEQLGGKRNWDYRFCWLRDATLTLIALMSGGYTEEARAWRGWLHRAVAGEPAELQIMYGISGERILVEWSPSWLPGYQGAAPVRIGNAAAGQLQLDIYGEVMSAISIARESHMPEASSVWPMQVKFIEHLEAIWDQPDEGIWETRGGRRQFTHSKVMAWVAIDRAIRDVETFNAPAPLDRWRALRERMHAEICDKGFDRARNTFTQSFGDPALDASLLLIPIVGFLPADDPRVLGTVAAIEKDLVVDGFVLRYRTEGGSDGLPPGEGVFLPCSFWLADAYAMQGRHDEAIALFERLLGLANDVGLLAEEYDPKAARLVGNFPQAYSHLALIGSVLYRQSKKARQLRQGSSTR